MSDDARDDGRDDSGGTQDESTDDSDSTRNGGGGNSGQNGGGGNSDQNDGGSQSNGSRTTTTAEKAVMVVSVLFTISLVIYGGWQMAVAPTATTPNATVVETETIPSGDVAVTVRLRNPGDVGLISATVEANCSTPPPSVELTYVPALSTRQGKLVCPPGTTDPNVSVANWVTP